VAAPRYRAGMTSPQYDPTWQAPPAGYYPPIPVMAVPYRRTNTYAILSLVFAFVCAPLAIVFGHIARKQIRQSGEDGDGLALAGLIIGYVACALALLAVALVVVLASALAAGHWSF
jgi:hypothetical protein